MTDRIITREISAHHAWQGPESEAPAFCNEGSQLAALGAAQGQLTAPRPPIQAEGYDIDAMVANLKAHPEWPAMNSAGDVKLYFMNDGDALAMRFAAALDGAE